MNPNTDGPIHTKVYTTTDGRAVIEQAGGGTIALSSAQILAVIRDLHACYDYCAAWRRQESDDADSENKP